MAFWDFLSNLVNGSTNKNTNTITITNGNEQSGNQSENHKSNENNKSKKSNYESNFVELDIKGNYDYRCILHGDEPFPDGSGGNAHGGTLSIKTHKMNHGFKVEIKGRREWKAKGDARTMELTHPQELLLNPKPWHCGEAAIIPDDGLLYRYEVMDGVTVEGLSIMEMTINGSRVEFNGTFSYYASEPEITKDEYEMMVAKKQIARWTVRNGAIRIYNRR